MSDTINNGGLAFPFQCQGPTTGPEFYYGMSLRDYFAAKAMQSLLACEGEASTKSVAKAAYFIADAMLRAREAEND